MRKNRLFTPGPTPLIPEAQLSMAMPMPHHRTAEFSRIMMDCRKKLQDIFKTDNELLILSSTGTGAMETAVSNLHSFGEKVLIVSVGKFGERWIELAEAYSLESQILKKPYGESASAEEILSSLQQTSGIKSLFIQGCETSTGTAHNLETISRSVREKFPDILIIVDAITAIGCQVMEVDQWDLDVVISGSQKSFGIPPGLSFISLGKRALEALDSNPGKNFYYLSLLRELKGQGQGSPAFTPSIALVMALQTACSKILRYGLDRTIDDAAQMAKCTRSGLEALGFRLLSKSPANATTAAFPPDGISAGDLKSRLDDWYGVKVAGGQGDVAGKIIRVAHLGYFDILDVFTVLSALELTLAGMGRKITPGAGSRRQ
ncbi:MAG: alanine--glyoxylate aminotransferase family protein [Acidobacteriota bacterium]